MQRLKILQYSVVAVVAMLWGLAGRLVCDVWLAKIGFDSAPPSILTFAVGPYYTWAVVALVLWTPLTALLSRATVLQSLLLGTAVSTIGIIVLYCIFVARMGLPGSASEAFNAILFFPIFVISSIWMGGFIAVPVTIVTASMLRLILRRMQVLNVSGEAA